MIQGVKHMAPPPELDKALKIFDQMVKLAPSFAEVCDLMNPLLSCTDMVQHSRLASYPFPNWFEKVLPLRYYRASISVPPHST